MSTWKQILDSIYLHYRVRRLRRLVNFFHVVLGIVLVKGWTFNLDMVIQATNIFLIFGIVMYSALHVLNNIADRKEDSQSKRKEHRLVASGQIPLKWLYIDVIGSILLSIVLLWYFYPKFLGFAVAFITLNIAYSYFFKRIHHVVGTLVMSWSIPLRLMLGVAIAGGDIWRFWLWYVLVWSGVVIEVSRKIQFEQRRYSRKMFKILRISLLVLFSILAVKLSFVGFRMSLLVLYCVYYIGYQILYLYSPRVRKVLYGVWTK